MDKEKILINSSEMYAIIERMTFQKIKKAPLICFKNK